MAKVMLSGNGIISLGSIHGEEDLKLRPGINLNPPPKDGCCECCGRHIGQLKPFGKAGDPLVGDFDGAYLVKNFRPDGPYDEEAIKACEEAVDSSEKGEGELLDLLIAKYGEEKGEELCWKYQLWCQTSKSWECRDCMILDEDEYFERLLSRESK